MSFKEIVANHFISFYRTLAENAQHPHKSFSQDGNLYRTVSNKNLFYNNVVIDRGIHDRSIWDLCIQKQLDYYASLGIPFVWYVDETVDSAFFERLKTHGFQDVGVFQGVLGELDNLQQSVIPSTWTLISVKTHTQMQEYNSLTTKIFGPNSIEIPLDNPNTSHFLAYVDSKPVSAISIYIDGPLASFWNGVTLPEYRKKGLSTALRRHALELAISKGCNLGISYLMSTSGASGICKKNLGYQTEWLYRTFVFSSLK